MLMRRVPYKTYIAITLLCVPCTGSIPRAQQKSGAGPATIVIDDLISTLKTDHPRLLMSDADWKRLDAERQHDPELARVVDRIEKDAKWLCSQPTLVYRKSGTKLREVPKQAIQRILLWGVAYHLSGDEVYATCAKRELLNLAWFPDWNPTHFLDTAEITAAVAIGYDWFYDRLSPADRMIIMRAIVNKALLPGINAGKEQDSWHRAENYWNQVCFGGLSLGALAIADKEPELSNIFLNMAKWGVVAGLQPYEPDGLYPDASGWGYGTLYQVLMLSALQSAIGTQWGLEQRPGFVASASVRNQLTGPSGRLYNFSGIEEYVALQPALFWFARHLNDRELLYSQLEPLNAAVTVGAKDVDPSSANPLFALVALWWIGIPDANMPLNPPLAWHINGDNPVGVFRSSWSDPNALYLAFTGGRDAGSFTLECDGEQWSNGLNQCGQNTLTLDPKPHRAEGLAQIVEFTSGASPKAVMDLTPVFNGNGESLTRIFSMSEGRAVSIRDELMGLGAGTVVRWTMATRANISIEETRAILQQNEKTLVATLKSTPSAIWKVLPANLLDNDGTAPNPGVKLLVADFMVTNSQPVQIAVDMRPVRKNP